MDHMAEYSRWLQNVTENDLLEELRGMDETAAEDAFYRDLAFGTGGLRGVLGPGTNRMNVYTVHRATVGLGKYMLSVNAHPSCAISCIIPAPTPHEM